MNTNAFQLIPHQASKFAGEVDWLFFFLIGVSVFFTVLIFGLVAYFAIRYRRRSEGEQPKAIHGDWRLELVWTVIPLGLVLIMFVWGAKLFVRSQRAPAGAMEIQVVAKQWMWKFQHPTGQREINNLHIPAGRPIKLVMTSEDVIHSLYVPAFRLKQDVLPKRYTTLWFEADQPGRYHLFCAEYCGAQHAGMGGTVVVLPAAEYEQWLGGVASTETPVEAGRSLFAKYGCNSCHQQSDIARGPSLTGVFGKQVKLATGQTVVADEAYLRESILQPKAKLVAGYQALMPTYQGLVKEEEVLHLIAYLKSLATAPEKTP